MPEVKVRLYGIFRDKVGKNEILINSKNLLDTIFHVANLIGKEGEKLLLNEDKSDINPLVKIVINGEKIVTRNTAKISLRQGDVVAIFPPVGGG